jgi:hypothetical protein
MLESVPWNRIHDTVAGNGADGRLEKGAHHGRRGAGSRLAAELSRGSPASVAIVVPFVIRPSVVARLAGVIEVLDGEGYDTIVCNVETPAQRDCQIRMLAAGYRAAAWS